MYMLFDCKNPMIFHFTLVLMFCLLWRIIVLANMPYSAKTLQIAFWWHKNLFLILVFATGWFLLI